MVKIGFICEGDTEAILLSSDNFQLYLSSINVQAVNVINACGSGNLLPHNIQGYLKRLQVSGAEVIFILTDLDENICITETKNRIEARLQDIVIVAVKKIEAWFLANSTAMQLLLNNANFYFDRPELEVNPFRTINDLLVEKTGRGVGSRSSGKIKLATKLLNLGFDLAASANHPNCASATYFINKLIQIGKNDF